MSAYEEWSAANDQFLSEQLRWLRRRLEELAASHASVPEEESEPARRPQRSLLSRGRRTSSAHAAGATPLGRGSAIAALPEAARPGPAVEQEPPALLTLAQRLGLSTFEKDVLLLCVAMELDTGTAGLCAQAQHDSGRPFPTFALALALFEDPAWDAMSPERPLRRWHLIEINQPGAQPLTTSALHADERIVNYVKGLNYLDDRLDPILTRVIPHDGDPELPQSQTAVTTEVVSAVRRSARSSDSATVQLLGRDGVSKRLVATQAAADLALLLYEFPAEAVPSTAADLETYARLWQRESLLSPVCLYVDAAEVDRSNPAATTVRRWLARGGGLSFLDVREPWSDLGQQPLAWDVAKPTPAEQSNAWQDVLPADTVSSHPDLASRLVGHFDFDLRTIHQIVRAADNATYGTDVTPKQVWDACLLHTRPALDQLAQRLEPKATWEDLKLPEEQEQLLRQITDQVANRGAVYDTFGFRDKMNRGLGISVLFAGESGTGKTMAAEVIANELGLLLYRIDLSAVVSKYIGETEKNLRKLFDAAEEGGAILFFDEADALFGKRSEVKDSHDRYANIEINYLLQRMETYRGLAILATNLRSAMDGAFLRRLRFIVTFPFPRADERRAMWQSVLPDDTPRVDLDHDRLARLNLTGGSIQNIALNGAFLAARSGEPVTMPLLLQAARAEFRKLDKPLNEADFRWHETVGGTP